VDSPAPAIGLAGRNCTGVRNNVRVCGISEAGSYVRTGEIALRKFDQEFRCTPEQPPPAIGILEAWETSRGLRAHSMGRAYMRSGI